LEPEKFGEDICPIVNSVSFFFFHLAIFDLVPKMVPFDGDVLCSLLATFAMGQDT
jgi:hypothetical protein